MPTSAFSSSYVLGFTGKTTEPGNRLEKFLEEPVFGQSCLTVSHVGSQHDGDYRGADDATPPYAEYAELRIQGAPAPGRTE